MNIKKYWNYTKSKIPLLWLIRGVSTTVSDIQHRLTSTKISKRGGENRFFFERERERERELLRDKGKGLCVIWTQADVGFGTRLKDWP